MNQHEWVYGCYAYYLENYIEPGNPEDGEWHDCHWPIPECLGGTKTIPLLKEHHAVHGVLQSEEWGRPCVYGWEKPYLTGQLHKLFAYWMKEKAKPAQRAAKWRWAALDLDDFIQIQSRRGRRAWEGMEPEERCAIIQARWDALPEESRADRLRKGLQSKWRCTVTGYITNPGSLTAYQRARGINTSNRERVN